DAVRELARIPFCNYLRSSVDLIANLARSLGQSLESFTEDDWDALLSQAFDRYFETSGLLGTPETCLKMIGRLKAIGVDEIGCLIDFGIDYERVIESLRLLNELRQESNSQKSISAEGYSLPSEIINHGVTHLQCTPSLARVLAQDSEARASLAAIANLFVGGEALPVSLARQLREMMPGRVRNMYGPTETTIWSATHAVEEVGNSIPIGRPILNTEIYVLDVYGNQSPVGVPGELAIGGDGVARGYFNRPGLTAEKFIPNRFSQRPGSRLYKTGDLARFLPCGNLEFLGRTDHQVKVRGFRVETGEVEAALTAHPAISEAAVVVHEDKAGGKRLVAYVVAEQGQVIEAGELRGYILEKLPVFMLPSSFVALGAMPLTLNGKLDRKALILRDVADDPQVKSEMIAPRTETELSLAKIWGDVLGIDRISVDENFFTMGGDSILSLLIIAKANRAGIRLTAKQFFENPTIAGLAAVAITGSGVQAQSSEVTGRLPLTPVQHWFFEQELADPHHYNQSVMLEVREPVAPSSMARVARSLLAHHDALRLRFKRSGAGWEQFNSPCDGASPFIQVDLSLLRGEQKALAINLAATQAQASLNLFEGPLMRVAAYDFGDAEPCRLQVAVHHLAIDGVSWRILLEDLQTAYGQLALGEEIQLSPKTTSFKQWAWSLAEHAQSESIKQESSYWLSALPANKARIPVDFPAGRNTEEHSRVLSIDLGADDTVKLLRRAPEFYRSEINDVLLLALARAFARWTGEGSLLVDVENMGRAELFEDVDLSRTVGWHTSLYPVLLNAGQAD
ncbi:MAG TPA: condensation domain-containing protein, partial [Blastocatellia bacterium]